jgi:hypothetical protein
LFSVRGTVFERRVTIIVGHFGSGKTEIAVNAAVEIAGSGLQVFLVDIDVVKPYFRTRSTRAFMAERGVKVIAPEGENYYADLPIILPDIRSLLQNKASRVLLDVGGDPVGTRALGSLSDAIPRDETDHLLVLNFRRPFTEDVEDAVTMVREIEMAARMPITGLISNTHLIYETTPEIVTAGFRQAEETARLLEVPLVAVAVDEATRPHFGDGDFPCPIITLRRMIKPPFEWSLKQRMTGPLFVLN